jgi:hypothetical protein
MNPVSLSLDLLLVVLLIAALGFCWRLERRLKGLRDSHADFAVAVADLDRAAQRAETGLAQLRQATDEAVDLLASRIEKARELTASLERLTATPAPARPRPANDIVRPAPERGPSRSAASERGSSRSAAPADPILAAESLARRLAGDDSLVLRDPAPPLQPRSAPQRPIQQRPAHQGVQPHRMPAQPPARPRPSFDDELFEAPARMAAGQIRSR